MPETPVFDTVRAIVADIFEVAPETLTPATRLFEDLPCESIDLLEIGAGLNRRCRIPVDDDAAFLRSLRIHLMEAERERRDATQHLASVYPHLTARRVASIVEALRDSASPPVLTLADITAYVDHVRNDVQRTGEV
jgi:acyl carrier protein